MNPGESPAPDAKSDLPWDDEPTWVCATCFAVIGFVLGGWAVFSLGLDKASPPSTPPLPGTADCGTSALGGLLLMFVGSPLAAIVSAVVAGVLGGAVDYVRNNYRLIHPDRDAPAADRT